jgi:hypothetical protein
MGVHEQHLWAGREESCVVIYGTPADRVQASNVFVEFVTLVVPRTPQRFTIVRIIAISRAPIVLLLTLINYGYTASEYREGNDVFCEDQIATFLWETRIVVILTKSSDE